MPNLTDLRLNLLNIFAMPFQLHTNYQPAGDQPKAIQELVDGVNEGEQYQTLLGVTGSGKTFTIANLIQQVQRPYAGFNA